MVKGSFEGGTEAACDKMCIRLVFPGKPRAMQSFRYAKAGNFVHKYQPTDVVEWKNYLKILALQQLPSGFAALRGVSLNLNAVFIFPLPKSARKRDIKALEEGRFIPHIKRPDLADNLMKGLCDALTGTVWADDSIISAVQSVKCYGLSPRIILTVSKCESEDSYLGNVQAKALLPKDDPDFNVDEVPF